MVLRIFKYTLLSIVALISLMLIGGFIGVKYYKPEIKQWIINTIETKSDARITLTDIGFKPFKFFPGVAISVSNVTVQSAFVDDTIPLLKCYELYAIINPYELIIGKNTISKFAILDGQLYLNRRTDGSANYDFFKANKKPKEKPTKENELEIGLEKIILDDVHFIYNDEKSDLILDLLAYNAIIDGNFSSGNLHLNCQGKVLSNKILVGDIDYAHNKNVTINGEVTVGKNKTYSFSTNSLSIENNPFIATGVIDDNSNYTGLDIKVKGDELNINKLLELLPKRFSTRLTEYDFEGDIEFDVAIVGKLSKTESPKIDINYEIFNTTLTHASIINPVNKLSFNGSFSNGWAQKLASSSIKFNDINASINGELLQGKVHVFNLVNPKLDIEANGYMELGLINSFLSDSSSISDINGSVTFTNAKYKGAALAFNRIEDKPLGISGEYLLSSVGFIINKNPIKIETLNFTPNNYNLEIRELIAEGPNSKINISGSTKYLREFILKSINPWMKWDKPIELNLTAKLAEIRVDSILNLFNTTPDTSEAENSNKTIEGILSATGTLKLEVGQLYYQKFAASNIKTEISFSPGIIDIPEFNFNAMSGSISAEAIYNYRKNKSELNVSGKLKNLSIDQLFYQFNNFGQQHLTSKNINGITNCTVKGTIPFANDTVSYNNIHLLADIDIKKGELINFAPLQELSNYIDIKELNHIRFNHLENNIEIKNGIIYIPDMEIQSSVITLALDGTHSLDNYINYEIKLNVMPILAGKIRKRKRKIEFQTVEEDEYNGFVTMKGPLDDPVIDFKLGRFKQQRDELKNAFRGKMKDYNPNKESQDWQVDEELEFLD